MRLIISPRKRVTLFAGHYGSGKTNLAVNYALALREGGNPVTIADMDIVNPYFRTKDSTEVLERAGVRLISPAFANTNLDLPALPAALYEPIAARDTFAVLDIGGDDRGAYALGRYAPALLAEDDFEMIFVVNFCRPLTRTPAEALAVMREIEVAARMPFTGIVNNSNLGAETTLDVICRTYESAEALAEQSGLPCLFTSAEATLVDAAEELLFPLALQKKIF